jgi:hypothetical protein
MTGERVGEWVLREQVGVGPVATVYRATSADDPHRFAAVKVFTHPDLLRPEFTAKFAAEALPLRRLQHPNIAAVYGAGVHAGSAWLATEFVEGTDAATLLRTRPRKPGEPGLPWAEEVLAILVQVARALKHGHHRSMLHRDLKPANVMVTPGGQVLLTGFGLAKLLPVSPTSLPAEPLGSLAHLPPEFFAGKPLTRRGDLYSLGCLAYTLLAGRPPFAGTSVAEFTHKHCYTLPDRPASVVPDLPPEFDEWVCDLLAKDPARRPASAAEAAEGLAQIRARVERKGRKVPWPLDPPGSSADFVLADEQVGRGDDESEPTGDRRPLMARPWVVVPLCVAFVAVVLAAVFWPSPSADQLYADAQPLLASADPADWDTAWETYLQPLRDKYPHQYAAEVKAARAKIDGARDLRAALREGGKVRPGAESERAYRRGLALASAGEYAAAQATWVALRTAFADQPAEAEWVAEAGTALAALAARPKPWPLAGGGGVPEAALQAARDRDAAGDAAGAQAVRTALEQLYAGDPASLARIRQVP